MTVEGCIRFLKERAEARKTMAGFSVQSPEDLDCQMAAAHALEAAADDLAAMNEEDLTPRERTKALVDVGTAIAAVESARNLAAYLEKVRPDLEESVASIRGLELAIQNSLPENAKEVDP